MPAYSRLTTLAPALPVLAALLAAMPARADLAAGMLAYDQGDYATALAEWRPLAKRGDATAREILRVKAQF